MVSYITGNSLYIAMVTLYVQLLVHTQSHIRTQVHSICMLINIHSYLSHAVVAAQPIPLIDIPIPVLWAGDFSWCCYQYSCPEQHMAKYCTRLHLECVEFLRELPKT